MWSLRGLKLHMQQQPLSSPAIQHFSPVAQRHLILRDGITGDRLTLEYPVLLG